MAAARAPALRVVRVAALAATLLVAAPRDARAWYFPEHAVIAHDAVAELPPEIRAVLDGALVDARREGLGLCPRADASLDDVARRAPLETRMIRSSIRVDCIPYVALPALAGDHSSSAAELRTVLTGPKAVEITSAVAYEWLGFEQALARLPNQTLERMSFVHALDVALYFIDPGYELRAQATRAHFVDAGRSVADRVRAAATEGDVDSALGQFLAHHLRSLGLAARGRRAEAILEHAFAVHFLGDAFAAGHLVMNEASWSSNARVRRRHDYFNALGLRVGYAMSVERCPALGADLELSGLPPCWVTTGDGYLGTSPDASDREHAARAVAKAELELAVALDPDRVVAAVQTLGEREQLALGLLVEPAPWWTVDAARRRKVRASAARTRALVAAEAAAVARLREAPEPPPVTVGTKPRAVLLDRETLLASLEPCRPAAQLDPAYADGSDDASCDPGEALSLGTVAASLLRPMLVEWPASQVDPASLQGESKEDLGWGFQILASAGAGALVSPSHPVDLIVPSVGATAGLSYRWGTYLPGRVDRAVAELNVGLSEALHDDTRGESGASTHLTFLEQELRWPILYELLTSYLLPLDLARGHDAGRLVFASGVRVREVVTDPAPELWGLELEAVSAALSRGGGSYPLYTEPPTLRLYLGAARANVAQPSWPAQWAPTVGLELVGGYATLL